MPITLAKMAQNTASVTINWGEDTVTVEYYPSQVTEGTVTGLSKGVGEFGENFTRIIKSWDVLGEDGSMYPIDGEHVSQLPLKFLMTIARAIIQDIRPND